MKRKNVAHIPLQDLSSWPTKRLLGRLRALRIFEESPDKSDIDDSQFRYGADIQFKSDPRWKTAYTELKSLLDNRENIRSGREDRLARIKQNKR